MSTPYGRVPKTGAPKPSQVNRAFGDLERLSRVTGSGDLGIGGIGGSRQLRDGRPEGFWARVSPVDGAGGSGSGAGSSGATAGIPPNAYAFLRVYDADDPKEPGGTYPDFAEGLTPFEGDGIRLAAYEVTGKDDVPDGSLEWLEPNRHGPGFSFQHVVSPEVTNTTVQSDWFWAEITAVDGGTPKAYSWAKRVLAAWLDWVSPTPGVSGTHNAYPAPIQGTSDVPAVAVGAIVPMRLSGTQPGKYEFLPWQYASATAPGLVSTDGQDFAGMKRFSIPGATGASASPYAEIQLVNGANTTYLSTYAVGGGPTFSIGTNTGPSAARLTVYGSVVYSKFGFGHGDPELGTGETGAAAAPNSPATYNYPAASENLGRAFKGGIYLGVDTTALLQPGLVWQQIDGDLVTIGSSLPPDGAWYAVHLRRTVGGDIELDLVPA